jgi:hypothetical protein
LRVNGLWWEDGVTPIPLEPALKRLASFVGAARIVARPSTTVDTVARD